MPDVVVEVDVDPDAAEAAAAALWAHGATAVSWQEGGPRTTLVAGFPTPAACEQAAGALGGRVVTIADEGWRDAWRAWAAPVPVGETLVVVPAWQPVPVGESRLVLEIDPGPCFGSGSHPSTRLLLRELAASPPRGASVLDVGTGSGILAVAAARLGAETVTAIDIDPAAVGAAAANAARNAVADQVRPSTAALDEVGTGFDLALVNVTAAVHARLGPAAVRAVRPGGHLLLAGLLPGQWRHVAPTYPGTEVVALPELDGWTGAVLRREVRSAGANALLRPEVPSAGASASAGARPRARPVQPAEPAGSVEGGGIDAGSVRPNRA